MNFDDDPIPEHARPFIDWVFSPASEIKCDDVVVRHGPNGFGLFAKNTIRSHACAIAIPRRLIIIADSIREIPEYAKLLATSDFPLFTGPETLALFYCLERFVYEENELKTSVGKPLRAFLKARSSYMSSSKKIEESPNTWLAASRSAPWFRSYFDMLPRRFGTPLEACFDDGKINAEKADVIIASLPHDIKPFFKAQMAELQRLVEKFTIIFGNAAVPDLFLWAWAVVNTRSVYIDVSKMTGRRPPSPKKQSKKSFSADDDGDESESTDSICMIPFFDLLNHSPTAQCEGEYNTYSSVYRVTAERELVRAGNEITICYGPHDNARLWLEYGFRLERNVFNRVPISLDMFILLARQSGLAVGDLSHHHEEVLRESNFTFTIFGDDLTPGYAARKCCQIVLMLRRQLPNWRRFIYDETYAGADGALAAQLTSAVCLSTVNDCESINDRVDRLLRFVLSNTRRHLVAKAAGAKTPDDMRSLWWDRVRVLDGALDNIDQEHDKDNIDEEHEDTNVVKSDEK